MRRLQRATSRRGPSVSTAPLLMGCILGTHGPYVYPQTSSSPPLPPGEGVRRSCRVSPLPKGEGIKGVRTDPKSETEARSECEGEDRVHPPLVGLVGPRRARSAVAPHPRSVPRARLRVHAATDAGEPRGGVLSEIPRAVSRSRDAGERQAAGCEGGV